jgi:hypothetical protein
MDRIERVGLSDDLCCCSIVYVHLLCVKVGYVIWWFLHGMDGLELEKWNWERPCDLIIYLRPPEDGIGDWEWTKGTNQANHESQKKDKVFIDVRSDNNEDRIKLNFWRWEIKMKEKCDLPSHHTSLTWVFATHVRAGLGFNLSEDQIKH